MRADDLDDAASEALGILEGDGLDDDDWLTEIAHLASLPGIAYDREREAAAERLGCRVGTLDKEVARIKGEATAGGDNAPGSGRSLRFAPPELHPEPVDGGELLIELAGTFRRFLALPKHADTVCALWVLHTHAFEASPITPRLAITSPEKRCGKTTLLELIGALVAKPQMASNISTAAVFRTIELCRPTLLIDEADTFLAENDELRGVLNSGHRRTGEVIRTQERDGTFEPVVFSTWAPVAIAMIGKLPGTLEDRSVQVAMRRRADGEVVERWRCDRLEQFQPSVRKLARWAADHGSRLADAEPDVPTALHDRAADNWRPLLAIADTVGGDWPKLARAAALALSGGDDAGTYATMLLEDLRTVFAEHGNPDRLASATILGELAKLEHRPWPEISNGKPMTPHKLARLLDRFGIVPSRDDKERFYRRGAFAEAWSRYLAPVSGDGSVRASGIQETRGFEAPGKASGNGHGFSAADGLAEGQNPRKRSLPDGLTLRSSDYGADEYEVVRI